MEILKNFGVDPLLLVAQVVNFLILLYILNRFFGKKILAFIRAREDKIKKGLEAATRGEELLEKAKNEHREILRKAREEGQILLANSKVQSEELAKNLRKKAEKEADRIIEEAREKAISETEKIARDLETRTVKISISVVEKVLGRLLTEDDQRRIIENLSKRVAS